ncbi:hypothetical protein [Brevundimonas sp.]|uniref:hypothetical protein n=1 Tax=Brevundimonas sp. TaxID=1871086 RepID=UPI003F71871F
MTEDVAELRATLPSGSDDAQIGRVVQVLLTAGAGQSRPGVDLVEISTALRDGEAFAPRVVNGVEVWQDGRDLVARPVTAPSSPDGT